LLYHGRMYIKKTLKKNPKTKKTYAAFHLVESVRTERGPRQRVLLYMGSEISLPEEQHKLLAQCIEDIVQGVRPLLPHPKEVEKLAQVYASQIIQRLSEPNITPDQPKREPQPEIVKVDVNTIEQSEPRSVGGEHLMLQMANQLKFPGLLEKLGFSKIDAALAIGSIIARALHPSSERETYRWLCTSSGLGELLDFDFRKSSLDKLYQVSDKLLTYKDPLEAALETIEQQFHGYESTIALYDLTNTYMEGQAKGNPKASHGVSKEKRKDCPLITMGLVMNEHGFLSKTSFLPGNAGEPKTLQSMIEALNTHQSLFKPTIILDAGIATEDNLAWLRQNGYMYVVSARQNAPSMEFEGQLVSVGDRHDHVKAAIISQPDNEEKWLYCESKAKAAVASSMKQKFKQRFEEDLKRIADGLSKPKGRKKHAKILERIGRLKEKHKRISGCYEVNAIPSEDGLTTIAVEWKEIEEKMDEKLTGRYFLRTNRTDTDVKELWQLYNVLRGIEDAFRFMKSSLGLRPVYHRKEHRVDGHLWITVLAYHLIQQCTYQLTQQEINYQWQTVRSIMMPRVRVTMKAKTAEGKMLYHRSTTKAEGEQLEIYRALSLSSSILRSQKTII
jgi:transposase